MKRWILAGVFATAAITAASAQEKPTPPEKPALAIQPPSSSQRTSLKVQFVLSRLEGEKRISSMPYTLGVTPGHRTSMRMGISVPVVTSKDTTAVATYSYRDVGTNIDCSAEDFGNGLYRLLITISDSSVQSGATEKDPKFVRDVPVFRTFNGTFTMVLRDGQTMQYASVTDPLSGEVMKVDVTVNLAK